MNFDSTQSFPRARFLIAAAALAAIGAAVSCSASNGTTTGTGGGGQSSTATATGGHGGDATSSSSSGEINPVTSSSSSSGGGGPPINPCGTGCGPVELCDEAHLGLDDNCNGLVDEGCACNGGQAHFCFKGDSSYHGVPGCFDGTEKCNELGSWGPCVGGVHATDNCFANDNAQCHAISAVPFASVDLTKGTGNFSSNAVPGSEVYSVTCPAGVSPCPMVTGSTFNPLVSGEYEVTYTKQIEDNSTVSCTFPLIVGARGLRIELDWEHDLGGSGVDLDLHLHQPLSTAPWSFGFGGNPAECMYGNCVADDFSGSGGPTWFSNTATPPDPVNWYLDPSFDNNTCYFAPHGHGQEWQDIGMGCHSPRLDMDNITCNPSVTDSTDSDFCAPENINIDFPPKSKWMRVGVHYFGNHGVSYNVHPRVRIYCDGQLAAELGPSGYYTSASAVTFDPSHGDEGDEGDKRIFWAVADVAFLEKGECSTQTCVVQPLFGDDTKKTPLFTFTETASAHFGPAYPPAPSNP
ncbi:Hypothetical protein A7982_13984 [Minicystis rosea]|nr:Hypothetical protein A7982_13984 [Minicystis rosea]